MGVPFSSSEKNAVLKADRGVSFEDVVFHILSGDILDTLEHPNQERYPGQETGARDTFGGKPLIQRGNMTL
jgi:hypothetical protein